MLELRDIQGPSVSGYKMPVATFLFLQIESAAAGRKWLRTIADTITTAEIQPHLPASCVNVAFTLEGLKQLGVRSIFYFE